MSTLKPYIPSADQPWDRRRAGHLLRRASLGATAEQLRRALDEGPAPTIRKLLDGEPQTQAYVDLESIRNSVTSVGNIEAARGWWLMRLVHTAHPMAAKMSLFWHDHFATGFAKVGDVALMLKQLATFERHALGEFGPLLVDVSKDPAMILWLDTQVSRRGAPNENYARELFELFALGVGHYTETDIREAARAFTGWRVRDGAAFFTPALHDEGSKTVLGQTGNFDPDQIVALVLRQPACAPFIAKKLLEEFVQPAPPDALIAETAGVLRDSEYSIRATVETILRSEAFFSDDAYRAKIKSPVEFVVGAVRSLEANVNGPRAAGAAARMGQKLFDPPSVKGWDGGRNWINSATLLTRMNAAAALARGEGGDVGFDAAALARRCELSDPTSVQQFVADLLLDGAAPESLMTLMKEQSQGADTPTALRRCAYAALVCPEYQLA